MIRDLELRGKIGVIRVRVKVILARKMQRESTHTRTHTHTGVSRVKTQPSDLVLGGSSTLWNQEGPVHPALGIDAVSFILPLVHPPLFLPMSWQCSC